MRGDRKVAATDHSNVQPTIGGNPADRHQPRRTTMKHLHCSDLFPGCDAEIHLPGEDDVLAAAAAHAADAHGVTELDAATIAAVRGAIRSDD
jgi:predicted small metal-binding protein